MLLIHLTCLQPHLFVKELFVSSTEFECLPVYVLHTLFHIYVEEY